MMAQLTYNTISIWSPVDWNSRLPTQPFFIQKIMFLENPETHSWDSKKYSRPIPVPWIPNFHLCCTNDLNRWFLRPLESTLNKNKFKNMYLNVQYYFIELKKIMIRSDYFSSKIFDLPVSVSSEIKFWIIKFIILLFQIVWGFEWPV